MATPLSVKIDQRDDTVVLIATGEIDLSNIDVFVHGLAEFVSSEPEENRPLTVDLSGVDYLDSGAISALFSHTGEIRIIANQILISVLTICGLASIIDVHVAPPTDL